MNTTSTLIQLVPAFFLQVPLIFCAIWLAPKMGARRWLWTLLTIIPVFGLFIGYVLIFRVAGAILDKLNLLLEKTMRPPIA